MFIKLYKNIYAKKTDMVLKNKYFFQIPTNQSIKNKF